LSHLILPNLEGTKPTICLVSGPTESELLKSGSRTDTGWLRCLLTEFTCPLLTMCNCLFIHRWNV